MYPGNKDKNARTTLAQLLKRNQHNFMLKILHEHILNEGFLYVPAERKSLSRPLGTNQDV